MIAHMLAIDWVPLDTWIVVIGVLCALACALPGTFLVLRRMSMMGDAISHAVLPGLAAGFLLTDSRASVVMFLGAAIAGVLTAILTQWVHGFGKVDRGAAMGVVFTTLFAIGLVMIVRAADHVDLDPGCVLYGSIELAPLDGVALGPWTLPRPVIILGGVLLLNAMVVVVFYKEMKISAFDPALATTLGINARVMHYLLMVLVAVTTVACFESIGSILVIAMLIVPPAAAHLLTDRLSVMILLSLLIGAMSSVLGHVAAIVVPPWLSFEDASTALDTNTAGAIATMSGVIFLCVMLLAPRHGVLSRLLRRTLLSFRIVKEDVLGLLYRLEEVEAAGRGPGPAGGVPQILRRTTGARPLLSRLALMRLKFHGRIRRAGGGTWRLTDAGRARAADLVRTHRLWEAFLHKHLPLAADHVHATAERLEHVTGSGLQRELAESLDRPTRDPHGKAIPPEQGGEDEPPPATMGRS